jgi:hypothetical protein
MSTPYVPVLMTALTELQQTSWAGRLPNVAPGQPFWCKPVDMQPLVDAGYARPWTEGDPPAPLPEPPWTAHGIPGIAAGTTNASH